ncbi:MAG: MobF family relaxase [Ilumatobacteraceae bacterium]
MTTLYASTASATASYYTKYLADAPGEVPGQWGGHQADLLGLTGEVSIEQLERLLSGHDPITDDQLGTPLVDRTRSDGKVIRAVAGFDATVSAPKSVSVLWALTGDRGLADAHDVAVHAVLAHLERYGSTTRVRSNGGRLHPDSQGLTVAGFRQTTSRADDPQLHTHLVISSKVQTVDGRWLALDARMLKRHQRTLGGIYQSVLRAELTHRYGVAFDEITKGQAEIAGVPGDLLERFSKRTAQVDDALADKLAEFFAREGRDPTMWERAALTREAAADTRGHKTDRPADELRPHWLDEAAADGHTPESIVAAVVDAARHAAPAPERIELAPVIDALSVAGSTWHREDIVRAICDVQRPLAGLGGAGWAAYLEHATDAVIELCVDLDPESTEVQRTRGSDGRSVWIEPIAARFTTPEILAEENAIIDWATTAQQPEPSPSLTVEPGRMDVLQRTAAAAVAGDDRLVLIVGPAGAGKTTTLAAAVADLHQSGRPTFGVAPTAKAARTLEDETAMRSDTVAKLVHEWTRLDRPPRAEWKLPAETTLIVDEAGLIGTASLHTLTQLADGQRWRVVLVGDPHQLQAVGRGGMFHELCTTGRTHELQRIHRFIEPWEAEASLQLRTGKPTALDTYEDHDRIRPGTLPEHLDHIADRWISHHRRGETLAVMASTNDHVHIINEHIQQTRADRGHYGIPGQTEIAGGEHAHVGDIIATRLNNRLLRTDIGEPVRNRDRWIVTDMTDDGDLIADSLSGHGTVRLPHDYASDHVQLGYATTEMGAQSVTADASISLASGATTCRNLYVAMTRGRNYNEVCVITDSHDIADARDILDRVINTDRADTPATTQERNLRAAGPLAPPRYDDPDNTWILNQLGPPSTTLGADRDLGADIDI